MLTKSDAQTISGIIKNEIQGEVQLIKTDLKTMKKDFAKIRADMSVILGFLDSEYV